jgi:hypothetical protein
MKQHESQKKSSNMDVVGVCFIPGHYFIRRQWLFVLQKLYECKLIFLIFVFIMICEILFSKNISRQHCDVILQSQNNSVFKYRTRLRYDWSLVFKLNPWLCDLHRCPPWLPTPSWHPCPCHLPPPPPRPATPPFTAPSPPVVGGTLIVSLCHLHFKSSDVTLLPPTLPIPHPPFYGRWGDETRRLPRVLSYLIFMSKPSTHHMHNTWSIVSHIRLKVFTDNQMSRIKYNYYISNASKYYDDS